LKSTETYYAKQLAILARHEFQQFRLVEEH